MSEISKTGRYEFLAEPFHCDFSNRLFMGHLGNHLLNAADFHSNDRGFGMNYLSTIGKTWVLSRLAVEMDEMPLAYSRLAVETWVESAMRYFTNRNFKVEDAATGQVYGYGRSVWAMIDVQTRQPTDLFAVNDGAINDYVLADKECPIERGGRVRMGDGAELVRSIDTYYSDVDINGHVNSVKYIEHVLDLWSIDWYRQHRIRRFEIAYVAEAHADDRLSFYRETVDNPSKENEQEFCVRITKHVADSEDEIEVVRTKVSFSNI